MSIYSITENFNKYFRVIFASTKQLKHEAFKIRHDVYCEELAWEHSNQLKMEMDDFDNHSYHCLLQHKPSENFAGCIRLVIPPLDKPSAELPFERFCSDALDKTIVDPTTISRGCFGEISRLAVLSTFRRRGNEKNQPFIVNDGVTVDLFSEEEKRNFPNISLGLYIAIISLAELCNHSHMFMMMEPKLKRRLQRFGLNFIQAGKPMDYHGQRALFYIELEGATKSIAPQLKELCDYIKQDLKSQMVFVPYNNPSDI